MQKRVLTLQIGSLLQARFPALNEEQLRRALAHATFASYKKGESLVEAGDIQTQLPILFQGVFRGYALDPEGRDITDRFFFRRGSVLMGSCTLGRPSPICIEAAAPSQCLMISTEVISRLLEEDAAYLRQYNLLLVEAAEEQWRGKMALLCLTAMERYERFLQDYPGLISTVCNRDIASFLGMTPVTLSRLRRKKREALGSAPTGTASRYPPSPQI